MEFLGQSDRLEELDRVGADVDAGAELGELGRLLVDVRLEALPAQRDGSRQPAKTSADNGDPACFRHLRSVTLQLAPITPHRSGSRHKKAARLTEWPCAQLGCCVLPRSICSTSVALLVRRSLSYRLLCLASRASGRTL